MKRRSGWLFLFALTSLLACGSSSKSRPGNLRYTSNPVTYLEGVAITANNPTFTGTVTSFQFNPALPAGLTLNAVTGVLTGTPTAAQAATVYIVTATGLRGSTTVVLTLTIALPAPVPATIALHPDGRFAYAANTKTHAIEMFGHDVGSATWMPLEPASIEAGAAEPLGLAVDSAGEQLLVGFASTTEIAGFSVHASGQLVPWPR